METPCHICGASSAYLMNKEQYALYRCLQCTIVFVHPQPTAEFLKQEVYSEKSRYQSNKARDLSSLVPTAKQQKIVAYLSQRRGHNGSKQAFLDIGCSSGDLMYFAEKAGYTTKGVELNGRTASIARANGLDVFHGFLEDAPYNKASFDIVHMGDLIEHVNDPHQVIRQAAGYLAPGGCIIIVTPNLSCPWAAMTFMAWKMLRIPWSCPTPPHHLFQFSRSNLDLLMSLNGFAPERAWYDRVSSLKYELGSLHLIRHWKAKKSFGRLVFAGFGYCVYSILFGANRLLELLPLPRVSMTVVYERV